MTFIYTDWAIIDEILRKIKWMKTGIFIQKVFQPIVDLSQTYLLEEYR